MLLFSYIPTSYAIHFKINHMFGARVCITLFILLCLYHGLVKMKEFLTWLVISTQFVEKWKQEQGFLNSVGGAL